MQPATEALRAKMKEGPRQNGCERSWLAPDRSFSCVSSAACQNYPVRIEETLGQLHLDNDLDLRGRLSERCFSGFMRRCPYRTAAPRLRPLQSPVALISRPPLIVPLTPKMCAPTEKDGRFAVAQDAQEAYANQ